jgi:hypothetical protein
MAKRQPTELTLLRREVEAYAESITDKVVERRTATDYRRSNLTYIAVLGRDLFACYEALDLLEGIQRGQRIRKRENLSPQEERQLKGFLSNAGISALSLKDYPRLSRYGKIY